MPAILQLLWFVVANPAVVAELLQLVLAFCAHARSAPPDLLRQILAVLRDPKTLADIKALLAAINQLLVDIKADLAA